MTSLIYDHLSIQARQASNRTIFHFCIAKKEDFSADYRQLCEGEIFQTKNKDLDRR